MFYIFIFRFRFVVFFFEVCNHFFNVVDMVIKTVYINQFFFLIFFSRSIFFSSNGVRDTINHIFGLFIYHNLYKFTKVKTLSCVVKCYRLW